MQIASLIPLAGLVLVGCSDKDKEAAQGAATRSPPVQPLPGGDAVDDGKATKVQPQALPAQGDKPPPPDDVRKGDSRIVNLLVDASGKPMSLDVWGKRSFEWGPLQLAKDVKYGEASPYFGIPKGMSPAAVPAGSGHPEAAADGDKVIGIASAKEGEEITTVIFRENDRATAPIFGMKPPGTYNAPEPPAAGKGLIYVYAGPLSTHDAALKDKYGGRSFHVGDGSATCLRQRAEDQGKSAAILGGTNATQHEVQPGKTKVTFHRWPGKKCADPAVFEIVVDVAADKGTFVILHSPDGGQTIEALQLPMWK
jgi:hypothetical protein